MPDSPYPELKKTHSMARRGRPWPDVKPPPSGQVWAIIQRYGSYWTLVSAIDLGVFDGIARQSRSRSAGELGRIVANRSDRRGRRPDRT